MTPDPATRARDLVAAWRDRDIRLDELLDETINRWLVESLVQDIAAALARPAAPEDDAGPLDRSRPEDSPAPVPGAARPTVEGSA